MEEAETLLMNQHHLVIEVASARVLICIADLVYLPKNLFYRIFIMKIYELQVKNAIQIDDFGNQKKESNNFLSHAKPIFRQNQLTKRD